MVNLARVTTEITLDTAQLKEKHLIPSNIIKWYLVLLIDDQAVDRLSVGRFDPTTGERPTVDLQHFGGGSAGVSRQHMLVDCRKRTVYVYPNSTNATFRNRIRIGRGQNLPLSNGDIFVTGHVLLYIRFVGSHLVHGKYELIQFRQEHIKIIEHLVKARGSTESDALLVALDAVKAEQNTRRASPDEPVRGFFTRRSGTE